MTPLTPDQEISELEQRLRADFDAPASTEAA